MKTPRSPTSPLTALGERRDRHMNDATASIMSLRFLITVAIRRNVAQGPTALLQPGTHARFNDPLTASIPGGRSPVLGSASLYSRPHDNEKY